MASSICVNTMALWPLLSKHFSCLFKHPDQPDIETLFNQWHGLERDCFLNSQITVHFVISDQCQGSLKNTYFCNSSRWWLLKLLKTISKYIKVPVEGACDLNVLDLSVITWEAVYSLSSYLSYEIWQECCGLIRW